MKGGVQLDRVRAHALSGNTGNVVTFFWGQALGGLRGPFGYYRLVSNDLLPKRGELVFGDRRVTSHVRLQPIGGSAKLPMAVVDLTGVEP